MAKLLVVATPSATSMISRRACGEALESADLVACEDTRVTQSYSTTLAFTSPPSPAIATTRTRARRS